MKIEVPVRELRKEPVNVFGHDVFVVEWNAKRREQFESKIMKHKDEASFRACVIASSLVDADGNDVEVDEIALGNLPATMIAPIYDACDKVNKLADIEKKDAN